METDMKPLDVLFLCETNAATSLMAEALVNHRNDARFRAFSAGRVPAKAMAAEALAALQARGVPTDALEPKSWTIFALPGARRPDLVIDLATVSWVQPEIGELTDRPVVRWPLRDSSLLVRRSERREAAEAVLRALELRIERDLEAFAPLLAPLDPPLRALA